MLDTTDCQVAALEEQCFRADALDVEGGQQLLAAYHAVEIDRAHATRVERIDEELRRTGLEPMGGEPPRPEQQQDVEGVVDPLLPEPTVAVVPVANGITVEAGKFRREDGVDVVFRVAANGCVGRFQGDVDEVVEIGEQTDLRELAHTCQEREFDMGFRELDRPIEAAKVVAIRRGNGLIAQGIEDRPVILVHQDGDAPPGAFVERIE